MQSAGAEVHNMRELKI